MARQLSRRRSAPVNPDPADDEEDNEEETEGRVGSRRVRNPGRGAAVSRNRPARSSSRREEPDEDDADYDDAPRRGRSSAPARKRQRPASPAREARSGWDNLKKAKARSSRFNDANKFSVDEKDEELILFLDETPFEIWSEHFIRELDGKKSFVCLEDDDCPLCGIGDVPGYRAAFNVAVFDGKGNPEVKYWIATPDPMDEIEEQAFGRNGPLTNPGNYYVVSKKKTKSKTFKYKVELITEDQVRDEFGFDPLDDNEISDLMESLFESKDVLRPDSRAKLVEAAQELSG